MGRGQIPWPIGFLVGIVVVASVWLAVLAWSDLMLMSIKHVFGISQDDQTPVTKLTLLVLLTILAMILTWMYCGGALATAMSGQVRDGSGIIQQ